MTLCLRTQTRLYCMVLLPPIIEAVSDAPDSETSIKLKELPDENLFLGPCVYFLVIPESTDSSRDCTRCEILPWREEPINCAGHSFRRLYMYRDIACIHGRPGSFHIMLLRALPELSAAIIWGTWQLCWLLIQKLIYTHAPKHLHIYNVVRYLATLLLDLRALSKVMLRVPFRAMLFCIPFSVA